MRYFSEDLCLFSLAALSGHASQNNKLLLRYQILFHKRFVFQIISGISCTAEAKVLKKGLFWGENFVSVGPLLVKLVGLAVLLLSSISRL